MSNWDDSDDDWDKSDDDDDINARLGLTTAAPTSTAPQFDDEEEDLAVIERERIEQIKQVSLKKKGNALVAKKKAEEERKEEEELARKAMELEAEMESKMTIDERRALEKQRVEDADNALTDDLFGGIDNMAASKKSSTGAAAGDTVKMKDLKDHLKHARKVAQCMKGHGKVHLAASFFKECLNESKDVLDDDAITDIIKACNVIKNEKVAAAKRKVKGQAQKSKKKDKAKEAAAKKIQKETFGDNDYVDEYDDYAGEYDDFF